MIARSLFSTAALAFVLTMPTLVAAQDETVEEDGLPIGREVQETGETYTAETHGDWEIRCIRAEEGQPEPCTMYQLLTDSNGNPVAEFNIFDLPDEGQVIAGATIVSPLDTLLTPGLRLRVDDGPVSEYPFAFCQQIGCFARLGLTQDNIDAFRAGGEAVVGIVPLQAANQVVSLSASLVGFTAGYEALETRNAETEALIRQLEAEAAAGSE